MKQQVLALKIAQSIDITDVQNYFDMPLHFIDSDQLFFVNGNKYISVFKYGAICFFGYEQPEIKQVIKKLKSYCKNEVGEALNETLSIQETEGEEVVKYDEISINRVEPNSLQIIMLNMAASVAIEYYTDKAELLHQETLVYTTRLEKKGSLKISDKRLKMYIGRSLNLMNRVSINLYIFETPPTAEDEYLEELDAKMKDMFDLHSRTRSLQETLHIVKENLEIFMEYLFHRKSSFLEWIIIILILIEVGDLFLEKFF